MADTDTRKQSQHGPKWLSRTIANPLWALVITVVIYLSLELWAYFIKQIALLAVVFLLGYSALWFIFHPNAKKLWRDKKKK